MVNILLKKSEHLAFIFIFFLKIFYSIQFFLDILPKSCLFGLHLSSPCNDIESPDYIMFDIFCNIFDVCCD